MPQAYFSKELFQFLVELKFNNERAWFLEQKPRYEAVLKKPAEAFLEAAGARLKKRMPQDSEAKLFRIYRDIRFSKDKTPYKSHVAMSFHHRAARDSVRAPGFYLHLEPGESYLAGGYWSPEVADLKKIRTAILKHPAAWKAFSKWNLWGDSYQRPPKGIDPKHPLIADLSRKHFMTWIDYKDKDALAPDFLLRFEKDALKIKPLVLFLNAALGLK